MENDTTQGDAVFDILTEMVQTKQSLRSIMRFLDCTNINMDYVV